MGCASLLVPENVHEFIEHTKAQFPAPQKGSVQITFELRISLGESSFPSLMLLHLVNG